MTESKLIQKIKDALQSGDRVIIIPVKDGVKAYILKRKEIK